ncbi:MAG TPA: isoprenylcysteine carboxylmethyltransferase family protein [Candidatus Acidoferrales bacterium]|nr:isoprenylcysteine carboxylmethyltransferase family protein [Candidatus Acidoferrales bacterium]
MKSTYAAVWPLPWTLVAIQIAWGATFIYFIASALLTNRIKRREPWSGRILDRVLLMGSYILLFSGLSVPGIANQHFMQPRALFQIAGAVMTYLGLPLTIWSRACLGRYWSGVVALKQDHRLIQSGPYRVVRHPLYSGLVLAAFGMAVCVTTWSSLLGAAGLLTCFERRAQKEDGLLAGEFGAEFEIYLQRTGRLIPRMG